QAQLLPVSYDDPYMATAQTWLRKPIGANLGYEIDVTCERVETYKPDGMVMGFYDFDRWLGAHQKIMSQAVEKKTGVPHFYMESDFWDDRDYSPEALRTRIESICQIVKMNKMMQG
ncbi:MAG TPA: 2-hydroxyacyl-CoA dehydratase family protein, partial [Deltaproteobacteria bacterium]|nr:2-hydroxyacyl-CoA dehydratase family protein [Deltaproteobacteria bacterium]